MAKEYEATITPDDENSDLLRLTMTGIEKNTSDPSSNLGRIVHFTKTESMEEIRKYRSVEDLRADINRERTFRNWEKVAAIGVVGTSFASSWVVSSNGPGILAVATIGIGLSITFRIWGHADDGLRKFNRAFAEYRNTRFNIVGKLSETSPAQS